MPAMIASGRRWLIGTDDLFIIGAIDVVGYIPCIVLSSIQLSKWLTNTERDSCVTAPFYDAVFSIFCFNMSLNWLISIGFLYFGAKGTLMQVEARQACVTLFNTKNMLLLVAYLWVAFAGYLLYTDDYCNSRDVKESLTIATVLQAGLVTIITVIWCLISDTGGSLFEDIHKKKASTVDISILSAPRKSFNHKGIRSRFQTQIVRSFARSKAQKQAVAVAAAVLAYVPRQLDMVLTDVAVGIILLRKKYWQLYKKEESNIGSLPTIALEDGSATEYFPPTSMPAWMNLHLARRYFQVGLDAFEWRWTVYRNITCGFHKLWNGLGRERCGRNIDGLHHNSETFYKDLIHASFRDKVIDIPFSISVDSQTSSVVISVSGTMSFIDVLANLAAGWSPIEDSGQQNDILCHAGMLKAARRIKDKLMDNGILGAAFEGREGHQLVTTGHSLGAAVSAILALLLRPTFPSVRCYAFEPPPCVCASSLERTYDCVFTVVLGNDVLPYLTIRNAEHMIKEVVKNAQESSLPKHRVIYFNTPSRPAVGKENYGNSEPTLSKVDTLRTELNEGKGSRETESQAALQQDTCDETDLKDEVAMRTEGSGMSSRKDVLCIPGRILHIRNTNNGCRLQTRTVGSFHPLRILPDMTIHHPPQYVEECLGRLGQTPRLWANTL